MAYEVYANSASTTLNGGISSSVTSLVVTSAFGFPTAGNFRILVDSEIMLVTGVAGATFTVTRAQEGTSGATHASLAAVTQILTKGALDQIRADNQQVDVLANLPAAGSRGVIYRASDSPFAYRDNGASWDAFGPIWKLSPPALSSFTWANQGSATSDTTKGGIYLGAPAGSTSHNINLLYKAAPTPPYTVTFGVMPLFATSPFSIIEVGWYDTVSQKAKMIGLRNTNNTMTLWADDFTNLTTLANNGILQLQPYPYYTQPMWLRIQDDGTNLKMLYSADGFHWMTGLSQAKSGGFLTPNSVGFGVNAYSQATGLTVVHYLEG